MTCIAVRSGVMAADSQATDEFKTGAVKLYRRKGLIVGIAGNVSQAMVFVDWLFDNRERKPGIEVEDDWSALVLSADGLMHWDISLRPTPIVDAFYAIGSGASLAMGAMEMGASARQAVRVACKRDPYCSGPVVTMRLSQKPRRS